MRLWLSHGNISGCMNIHWVIDTVPLLCWDFRTRYNQNPSEPECQIHCSKTISSLSCGARAQLFRTPKIFRIQWNAAKLQPIPRARNEYVKYGPFRQNPAMCVPPFQIPRSDDAELTGNSWCVMVRSENDKLSVGEPPK